jgi:hypothetical protein
MNKTTLNRMMGIAATLSALLISVADFLLEYSPEYGISGKIVESAWATMPEWRFSSSIYLCAFLIPFYIPGFWLLYKSIRKSSQRAATLIFILFSYGVIMGSPLIHTSMCTNPMIYKFGLANNLSPAVMEQFIGNDLTAVIFPVFISHYIITWLIAPAILFFFIIRGKSDLKPWVAFINPLVFLIIGMLGLLVLPDLFKYITPGAINKGNAFLFLVLTIKHWNSD